MSDCDLCGDPVLPGQARFGGSGDGGRSGSPIGFDRHYACHEAKHGRALSLAATGRSPSADALRSRPVTPAKPIKRPVARCGPYNRSENAAREWLATGRVISEMGRRRIEVECPFCHDQFWAFVWSLAGGGKRCPNCGAMHTSHGTAHPVVGNEDL